MRKKTPRQLEAEIAEALSQSPPETVKLKDRYSGGHVWLTIRDGRIVGVMGADPGRYMGMTLDEAKHYARHGGRVRSGHATAKLDRDDARMFGRYARRMEQTRQQALTNARAEGFAAHQLGAVEEGWEAERGETTHGGFAGTSHATRRQAPGTATDVSHARRKARAPRLTPYRLHLTPDELRAVEFARGRYAWPDMLSAHAAGDGSIALTESEMWQWTDDVDSDAEGGHSPFPLASGALVDKLQRFYDSRI